MSSSANGTHLPPFDYEYKPTVTEIPNPNFTYGQKVSETEHGKAWVDGEKQGWKVIDTATYEPPKLYSLMISGVVPRPIAFVSSVSATGVENLAPFSWFNMVTHFPPVISVSCAITPNGGQKDTTQNIKATKQFTVNIISEPFVENANMTSLDLPANVSEWPLSGLTREPSIHVKAPRVKESAFSMECELLEAIPIIHPANGMATTTLILGSVKCIHVREDVLNERGNVDITKFKPVGRLGDISYVRIGAPLRVPRSTYEAEQEKIGEFLKSMGA